MTADEMFESLNGFDEIAIRQRFGVPIGSLAKEAETEPFQFIRALAFVAERRAGKPDDEAFNAAMTLSGRDALAYFHDQPIELDPTDPDTAPGKDA